MSISIRQYWELLAAYLRPQWPRTALLAALLLGGIGFELVSPQIVRDFIDTAMAGGAHERLISAALLFIGVALAQQLAAVGATYVGENVGWTATNALRADLLAHCLRLDMSFHKARTPGELIERIDGDVTALSRFFAQFVVHLLSNVLMMAGVLALLFREDWRVGAALTAFAAIAVVSLQRIQAAAVPHWAALRQHMAELFGFLGELLAGTEDVRANGAAGYAMARFHRMLRAWLPLQLRAGLASFSMWITTLGLFTLGNATAFALGAWLYGSGAITIGTVYLIFNYTELLRRPLQQIRNELQDLQTAGASIVRVRELLETRSLLAPGRGVALPAGALDVEFDRVGFVYDDRAPDADDRPQAIDDDSLLADDSADLVSSDAEPSSIDHRPSPERAGFDAAPHVLTDISFRLAPGRVLGLLGRTGSGKTTIARLLLRLYDPTSGAVRLGGVDLRDAGLAELRGRIGMVTQDVQIFQATLRDNLTLFDDGVDDARLVAVLEELGLGAWLRSLPQGLDTELAAGGGLSAGEAQLLALARVFLRDPGLVIMDEASSRLDPATERLIERAIDRLLRPETGRRTAIIIAHRLGTIERADDILILEDGRIVEYGERATLAADPTSRLSAALRTGMEGVLV